MTILNAIKAGSTCVNVYLVIGTVCYVYNGYRFGIFNSETRRWEDLATAPHFLLTAPDWTLDDPTKEVSNDD